MENLGRCLKYYREQSGLSQIDLSEKSNISQASIARIEAGKQKNLKRETMRKLADGLGVSLTELMEPVTMVKEDTVAYVSAKTAPVLEINDIAFTKDLGASSWKPATFKATLSGDKNAFYLRVGFGLTIKPVIDEGNLILIEPAAEIREGDMVLFLSTEMKTIGKVYYPYDNLLIQPLDQNLPPIMLRKKEKGRPAVRILRVGGIIK